MGLPKGLTVSLHHECCSLFEIVDPKIKTMNNACVILNNKNTQLKWVQLKYKSGTGIGGILDFWMIFN